MGAWVRACVRVCVCVCVRARACVRVCVCVRVRVRGCVYALRIVSTDSIVCFMSNDEDEDDIIIVSVYLLLQLQFCSSAASTGTWEQPKSQIRSSLWLSCWLEISERNWPLGHSKWAGWS